MMQRFPAASRLISALARAPVDSTPVWFMRQAGRSLPRYRALRAERAMFDLIRDPAAAAEITLLPLESYSVDALVLFSDLVTPVPAAGIDIELRAGTGPVVAEPITSLDDLRRLRTFDSRVALDFSLETIRLVRRRTELPVIGFVGAPFTLLSYLVESPRTRDLTGIRKLLGQDRVLWDRLAGWWVERLADFAVAQHEAGAAAIQVFDSWAGVLSPADYAECVKPHSQRLLRTLADAGVPTIHFATGNPALLPYLARAGGDAIGVDWRVPLDEAWSAIGTDRAIQGNLDPTALLAGEDVAVEKARDILDRAGGRPGHIFNLGHGMLPETDPAVVRAVVDFVHDYTRSRR